MFLTAGFWLLTLARMMADAQFLNSRISKLEGAGDLGSHIVEIVKNKEVAVDSQQSQPSFSEKEGTSSTKAVARAADVNGEQEKT